MAKKVFVVHAWGAHPDDHWYPWLKSELEKKGFHVTVPGMPDTDEPDIKSWVSFLKKNVKSPDSETFFIGHSIGCQAIMRYLGSLPPDVKVGNIIFVAGWFNLKEVESNKEWEIARPWLETPVDFAEIKRHAGNFVALFSDDDSFVPISDAKIFEKELNAKVIVKHGMGHFTVDKIPDVLDFILKM